MAALSHRGGYAAVHFSDELTVAAVSLTRV